MKLFHIVIRRWLPYHNPLRIHLVRREQRHQVHTHYSRHFAYHCRHTRLMALKLVSPIIVSSCSAVPAPDNLALSNHGRGFSSTFAMALMKTTSSKSNESYTLLDDKMILQFVTSYILLITLIIRPNHGLLHPFRIKLVIWGALTGKDPQ